jgi:hypothetical protein
MLSKIGGNHAKNNANFTDAAVLRGVDRVRKTGANA